MSTACVGGERRGRESAGDNSTQAKEESQDGTGGRTGGQYLIPTLPFGQN